MGFFDAVDWQTVMVPKTPLLETFFRGTAVYLMLFLLLRLVLKREAGTVGVTDLLVVVLIADAAQNAMANDYQSIPDGMLLVSTILFWSYALNWLGYRFPRLGRFIHPPPLQLISEGKLNRRNLRKELITLPELRSQLREQGIKEISEVQCAYIEGDGKISVIKRDGKQHSKPKETTT